ncbi:hypothetical protein GA0116948_102291 [Chitinophaga costaii]|uniref:Uncharacterized protein n=2 Tax=Chitinophaga costaii TaxID=1335309 RepID=A0A1C4AUB8_9BACT|nr:hypothetical protein GA0116948_102291 [Chitinophaga costaii]
MTQFFTIHPKIASLILIFWLFAFAACKKNGDKGDTYSGIKQHTIVVESIIGTNGDILPSRAGFIDLYDGKAYNQVDGISVSSKIDLAYNYHGGGCPTCRFFENVKSMSSRTYYVKAYSFITDSQILGTDEVTETEFEALKTKTDLEAYFARLPTAFKSIEDIARDNDVAKNKIFAFVEKNGKKGFLSISDYVANVPDGDRAVLTLNVKVEN